MKITDNISNAVVGFNILGLLFSAAAITLLIVGVIAAVTGATFDQVSLTSSIMIILIPFVNFIIAYGFKTAQSWAWYLAVVEMALMFLFGISSLLSLSIGGVLVLSFFVLRFLMRSEVRRYFRIQV